MNDGLGLIVFVLYFTKFISVISKIKMELKLNQN
jgi:hypothetical protein